MSTEDRVRGFVTPAAEHFRVRIPRFAGQKRIVHLTDLHFGNVTPLRLQELAVEHANRAAPDLVVLTGDFVARGRGYLGELTRTLAGLEAPAIAVLGNHDHWCGADDVRRALKDAGVEVIDNDWTLHGSGEDRLAIAAIDDHGTHHDDVHEATKGLHGVPTLALSHNPEAAPLLWESGAHVVLSGHTHGGQFWVDRWTEAVWKSVLGARYIHGWYAHEERHLYVNPGVGSSVVPFRYGRPAMRTVAVLEIEGGEDRIDNLGDRRPEE